jgi:hypothetical protein
MIALLAGICIKGDNNICPPGSFEIKAAYALIGAFVFIALVCVVYLGNRSRRP